MNWTLWQNIVSPHLSPVARALASIPGHTVTVVAESQLPEERRTNGWETPDCFPAQVLIGPTNADVARLVSEHPGQPCVHLLNGLANVALNRRVLSHLANTQAMIGLISERPDNRGILGFVRKIKYQFERYRFGHDLDFVLAMGASAVEWFQSVGYEPSRIFPFGYMTERPECAADACDGNEPGQFRILYLGQILRRKDGVTAIRALDRLSAGNWHFDVVGNGPDLERWKRMAGESRVADRVRFRPAVINSAIGNLLKSADLLLLPSRNDGWGAVVNEALMSGVPVVCSDHCGAADLLRAPWRGSIFKAGSPEHLRCVLQPWIEGGRRTEESSSRIREWSSALEGPQVARYLVEIVAYMQACGLRPSPPWY